MAHVFCIDETNLRAEACETLYASDASPSGAGGCFASTTREDWLGLYDLVEEKGELVRFDWKGEEPPSNMHDVLAAAAPLALKLKWPTLFSYCFFACKHINLLGLESTALGIGGFARGLGIRLRRTVDLIKN